jgi:hypothetical protein
LGKTVDLKKKVGRKDDVLLVKFNSEIFKELFI